MGIERTAQRCKAVSEVVNRAVALVQLLLQRSVLYFQVWNTSATLEVTARKAAVSSASL